MRTARTATTIIERHGADLMVNGATLLKCSANPFSVTV